MSNDISIADILPDFYDLRQVIAQGKKCYAERTEVFCPYFDAPIALTSDGLNHLTHKPNRAPRNINEQRMKLRLLRVALKMIGRTGTLQEHRKHMEAFGEVDSKGYTRMKNVEYWAFHHILCDEKKRLIVRVIVRRVGDGKIHFWSVMPHGKLDRQKFYETGIDVD